MSTVPSTGFQQIDPQAVEARLAGKVERALFGEGGGMADEQPGEVGERGIAGRQVVERRVARVAGIMMLAAPAAAGAIVGCQAADRKSEIREQRKVADFGFVERGDEQ